MELKKTCSKCKKIIPFLTEFPSKNGDVICLDCYEKEFKNFTEEEKVPNFYRYFWNFNNKTLIGARGKK